MVTSDAPRSYASGTSSVPLLGETIDANLRRAVERFGSRDAVVDVAAGRRLTYTELDAVVDEVARGLFARGVQRGDRVGISTLISAISFKTSEYRQMVEQVRPDLGDLADVIYLDDPSWDALIADGANVTSEQVRERSDSLSFDDAINIQYTSGTTGFPKGATLSHHNILNNGFFVGEGMSYTEQDRICVPVPFYHCFGMVMGNLASTSHGACVVIPAPGFDPAATLRAVQQEQCTSLYGVPTMFIAELGLADFADYDLSSLRTGIMAGSPCPVEVMKRVVGEMGMNEVTICYGMTETSPVSTQTGADDDLERRTSTVG